MFRRTYTLEEAKHLPRWRQPVALLALTAAATLIRRATSATPSEEFRKVLRKRDDSDLA